MKKQTAIEWLVEELFPKRLTQEQYYCINKAKEMEKNQIIIAYNQGCIDTLKDGMKRGEQYYKETFNKDE
jgi:hypothetical protein